MLTVNKLLPQGRGLAPVLRKRAATVELDWDLRQKSRFDATDSAGRTLGVFLPRGTQLRGGDALVAEDGSIILVQAAPQAVLVVRPCAEHGSAFDLLRAAYHLGNRHVQLELKPDHLKFEPDHVLADMLRAMHLIVTEEQAAFEPESGAYAQGGHGHAQATHDRTHEHAHEHPHDHAHEHPHDHAHGAAHAHHDPAQSHAASAAPVPAPARGKPVGIPVQAAPAPHGHEHGHGHVHGPGCDHDHGDHHH